MAAGGAHGSGGAANQPYGATPECAVKKRSACVSIKTIIRRKTCRTPPIRPSGIAIRDGLIYVADSESNGVAPHPGWKRGIRIGNLADGRVLYRGPDPLEIKGTSGAEGVAVDAKGVIYGGEVGLRQLARHRRCIHIKHNI